MLIPNLKIKLRNKAPMKSYFKKTCKTAVFLRMTFYDAFFKFCLRIWSQCKILRLLVPMYIDLFKEKRFQLLFLNNNTKPIVYTPKLYGFVSFGRGDGGCDISSNMLRTTSNLPKKLCCP